MIVYQGTKSSFVDDVNLNVITDKIHKRYQEVFHHCSNAAQVNSWQNSMQYMRGVLSDDEIPGDAGVAIEYNVPTTSKRIDFILSGYNEKNTGSVIIVELKQWEKCEAVPEKDGLVRTYVAGANREVDHPSYQAMTYAYLIENYNDAVTNINLELKPCAFLHNYVLDDNDPINSSIYKEYIEKAPLFGKNDFGKLREFIKKYVKYGDNKKLLIEIDNGKIRPSKMLQDTLASMIDGNKEFYMIDDQKVIYENALYYAKKANKENTKFVHIVQGGPGTGKTVVAINLLVELTKSGLTSFYVSKNSAPRNVFEYKLKNSHTKNFIDNLFKGSGSFVESKENEVNTLIVDEAHRLTEKSGLFSNLGENQIKEIINAANYSIFFIDESQKVTTKDIGSIDMIMKYADELGAQVKLDYLTSQFRCNGSDGYLAWLDDVLDIRNTANFDYDGFNYDFKVVDDPNELRKLIIEKNNINNKSRLVAGYCWDWIKEGVNDSNTYDICIGKDFKMSWNLKNTSTYAIDDNSINEIGCIHTCQGLEFDYVGVIIGEDIRYENGHIVTDMFKRAKTDQSIKGLKGLYKTDSTKADKIADEIIKNTYRTLMTRGMKGCYVYCVDKGMQEYLKQRSK